MDVNYIFRLLSEYVEKYPDVLSVGSEILQNDVAYDDANEVIRKILDSLIP